MSNWF
jgi:hypothetical protein